MGQLFSARAGMLIVLDVWHGFGFGEMQTDTLRSAAVTECKGNKRRALTANFA